MPLYEYICKDCGHPFEKLVPFSEMMKSQPCPNCQSKETEKRLSQVASFSTVRSTGAVSSCGSGGFS